jgi:hypothetical protein
MTGRCSIAPYSSLPPEKISDLCALLQGNDSRPDFPPPSGGNQRSSKPLVRWPVASRKARINWGMICLPTSCR